MDHEDNHKIIVEGLVKKTLSNAPVPKIPDSFTDKLMARIERRVAAKQVLGEFLLKAAISVLLIAFASGVVFIPAFGDFLDTITGLAEHRVAILYITIIIAFTLLFDQVILRFMLRISHPGHKSKT